MRLTYHRWQSGVDLWALTAGGEDRILTILNTKALCATRQYLLEAVGCQVLRIFNRPPYRIRNTRRREADNPESTGGASTAVTTESAKPAHSINAKCREIPEPFEKLILTRLGNSSELLWFEAKEALWSLAKSICHTVFQSRFGRLANAPPRRPSSPPSVPPNPPRPPGTRAPCSGTHSLNTSCRSSRLGHQD